jgi:5-methylcytosine-specific restriction enzyme A
MPTINPRKRPWHTGRGFKQKKDNFYNNQPWRKLRKRKLINDPLCEQCKQEGRTTAANTVDHIRPRRWWPDLELEYSNLRSNCTKCHNRKSAKETVIKSREQYEEVFDL